VSPRARSRLAQLLALLVLALGALVGGAGPAAAHATLDSTTPDQGAEVAQAPASVVLRFSEDVTPNLRSLEVLDPGGGRVDDGRVTHPAGDGTAVQVGLRPGLGRASYAVVWRVVSADGHPVSGTFSFGVGVAAGAAPDTLAVHGSALVGVLHTAAHTGASLGLVLLVGGAGFLALLWPAGAAERRPRLLVVGGWCSLAVSAPVLFLLEGPYATGLGLSGALDGGVLGETLASRMGKLLLVRLLLLGLAVPALRRLGEAERGSAVDLGAVGATLLLTFSLTGHPGVGSLVALSVAADALHLAAVCLWLGGLTVLGAALLRPGPAAELPVAALRAVLPRWHRLAVGSVVTIAVTGTYATWREVGTLPALPATAYGRLLLVKIGSFVLLLALGDLGRRWVRRYAGAPRSARRPVAHAASDLAVVTAATAPPATAPPATGLPATAREPDRRALRGLRRSVGVELLVGALVLGVTAVLTGVAPARETYSAPFASTVTAQAVDGSTLTVQFDVDRTSTTPGELHVYAYTPEGRVQPVTSVTGQLLEREKGLGPVRVTFASTGPGHVTGYGVVLPAAGHWDLTLQLRVGAATGYAATTGWDVR